MRRRTSLAGLTAALAVSTAGVFTSTATAASIVSVDFGQPKAGIATVVNARTIADEESVLRIMFRATGGPPCAPTSGTDPGTLILRKNVPVGDTTATTVYTFPDAGSFQLCGWLSVSQIGVDPVVATTTGTFDVASPVGAITGVVVPPVVEPGQDFIVEVTGSSEVTRRLLYRVRPAGEPPCAPTPGIDPGTASIRGGQEVLGAFTQRFTLAIETAGAYRLCTWVAEDSGDINALGVNETPINVSSPAPPAITVTFNQPRRDPSARIVVSVTQLRINQRISQHAIRRLAELEARIDGRPAPPARTNPNPGAIRLTTQQLRINQRIAEFSLSRANALIGRLEQREAPVTPTQPRLRLSVAGIRANQRTLQDAVVRVNGIAAALDAAGL